MDIQNVESMKSMFNGCYKLNSIPKLDNWGNFYFNKDNMFTGCTSLPEKKLPSFAKWK